ncbi:hypothetical protein GALMADRAFT_267730 [Galerina marginata CBS 339.88]|uniref:Uncharacterized protein n=1 Tax=Galerina marginata (strain CBS 339.88) TaxID=685588 RepID=A0A067SYS0_GALM3|nr:hypothetical protein GALMADRAFT_267730 [Galerina marginata CBS 339.88]
MPSLFSARLLIIERTRGSFLSFLWAILHSVLQLVVNFLFFSVSQLSAFHPRGFTYRSSATTPYDVSFGLCYP